MSNWAADTAAQRTKKAKDNVAAQTRQLYEDFSKPIITGDLEFDEVDQSPMLKADKEKWFEYIRGSYEDAPTVNTPRGQDIALNAVYDAATKRVSPKEAYDILLEARFIDQSITDDQFNWGVDKIENPYPKDIIDDIRITLNSNLEDFNRVFSFDNERNKKVNEQLIAWVDKQLEDGKSPTKKEMFAMSSQFRVGDDRWYDIGQTIEIEGQE